MPPEKPQTNRAILVGVACAIIAQIGTQVISDWRSGPQNDAVMAQRLLTIEANVVEIKDGLKNRPTQSDLRRLEVMIHSNEKGIEELKRRRDLRD